MISYPLASCVFLVGVFDFNRAPAFYPGPAVFQFGCDIFLKVAIEFPLGRDCSFKRELLFWRSRNGLAYLRCWRMRFAEGDHQTNSEEYRSRHHDRFAASHGSCFFLNGVVGFKKLKSPISVSYLAITGRRGERTCLGSTETQQAPHRRHSSYCFCLRKSAQRMFQHVEVCNSPVVVKNEEKLGS